MVKPSKISIQKTKLIKLQVNTIKSEGTHKTVDGEKKILVRIFFQVKSRR